MLKFLIKKASGKIVYELYEKPRYFISRFQYKNFEYFKINLMENQSKTFYLFLKSHVQKGKIWLDTEMSKGE